MIQLHFLVEQCLTRSLSAFIKMMLFTLHVVAIGAIIGITAHLAFSMGEKNGMRIARREQEIIDRKKVTPEV